MTKLPLFAFVGNFISVGMGGAEVLCTGNIKRARDLDRVAIR